MHAFAIHDKGLSTNIERRDIRGYPSEKRAQLYRLRRWQRRIRFSSYEEKNLASALTEMHRIADPLNLPKNVLETAAIIYRKAVKKHLIRGRSIRGMVVATLYLACRRCKILRTIEELSQAASINKVEVARISGSYVNSWEILSIILSKSYHFPKTWKNVNFKEQQW